jgi:protein-disulfide isomerase
MRARLSFVAGWILAPLFLLGCEGATPAPTPGSEGAESPQYDLSEMGFNAGAETSAVVRVVEFSDFGCVFCARFHTDDYHVLEQEFIDSGDVLWKYVPITIGGFPNGDAAALAGICAGEQARFPEMRDLLFETREIWMAETEGSERLFAEYASQVGLDTAEFAACVAGEGAHTRLAEANEMARAIQIRGTPTFIVEGFPVQGAPALEDFQQALRGLIAEMRGDSSGQ